LWKDDVPDEWYISLTLGSATGPAWSKGDNVITGLYTAVSPATGNATVAIYTP